MMERICNPGSLMCKQLPHTKLVTCRDNPDVIPTTTTKSAPKTFKDEVSCSMFTDFFITWHAAAYFIGFWHFSSQHFKKIAKIWVASDSVFMLFFLHPFRVALEKLHQPLDNVARTWTPTAGANERKNSWQMTTTTRQPLVIEIQAMKVRSSINFSISPLLFSHDFSDFRLKCDKLCGRISTLQPGSSCLRQGENPVLDGWAPLIHVFVDLCLFSLPFSEGTNPS